MQVTAGRPVSAAKPLILYYCYLNLVKSWVLTKGQRKVLDAAKHGLSERLGAGRQELNDAYLEAFASSSTTVNVFDEFLRALRGSGLNQTTTYPVPQLIPQVVPGHRLWIAASAKRERFLGVERLTFVRDAATKEIWLRLYVYSDNLRILDLTHAELLSQTNLTGEWREVKCSDSLDGRRLVCCEQTSPTPYASRAPDEVPDLIAGMRPHLWATALMYAPWRRYYLYAPPTAERGSVLPQLASIYALTHYFGSIARYRPHHFQSILAGPYGPWLQTFLNEQPTQFVFLIASDIVRRDLLKAAIA